MSNLYLQMGTVSGLPLYGTVERLSDNFYRAANAETFSAAPTFYNKAIPLAEGVSDNRGTYRYTADASTWSEGLYTFRVHDSGNANRVLGVKLFGVRDGYEYNLGQDHTADNIYYSDIIFTKDKTNSVDEYNVSWYKNGSPVLSGITNPAIQVIKRADGTNLVAPTALTQIGTTAVYKYDESTNKTTAGEAYIVSVSGTIDASTRSWRKIISRDST